MSEPKRTAEAALSYGAATQIWEIPTLTIAERRAQYLAWLNVMFAQSGAAQHTCDGEQRHSHCSIYGR